MTEVLQNMPPDWISPPFFFRRVVKLRVGGLGLALKARASYTRYGQDIYANAGDTQCIGPSPGQGRL